MRRPPPSPFPAFLDRQPPLGREDLFRFPLPKAARLPSGLRLLVLERRGIPLVSLNATLKCGTLDDPVGAAGVAYVTGQMLVEGAAGKSPIQVSREVRNLGAHLGASVDRDSSSLSLLVLRDALDEALGLFFDVLLRPNFWQEEFERVRAELRAHALERLSYPTRAADLVLRSEVFGTHPQAAPLLPHPDEIDRLDLRALARFHRAQYRPQNTILVAAGDISLEELVDRLTPRLQRWRGNSPPPRRLPPAPRTKARLTLVSRPDATQSVIRVGCPGPSRLTPDFAKVQLLATLFGGSFTSRLSQNLRERHGFTYDVHSSFALSRGPGLFAISTSVETQDTAAALEQIFLELERIGAKPPGARELSKARRLLIEELPARAESLDDLVEAYSTLAQYNLPLTELDRLATEMASVRPEEIMTLARHLLDPRRMIVVAVGDAPALAAPLEARFGEARWVHLTTSGPLPQSRPTVLARS